MTDIRLSARPTLAGAVWPERQSVNARAMRAVLLALLGSGMLALSSKVAVPFLPVPMTLQSLVVLLIGASFGSRLAVATVVLYLVEGMIGLPVFTGTPERGIGLTYMVGPTGGYLLGWVATAAIVGALAERGADRAIGRLFPAMLVGNAVAFVCGFAWLAHLLGADAALRVGVLPFLPGDLVKTLLAAMLVPAVWGMLAKPR